MVQFIRSLYVFVVCVNFGAIQGWSCQNPASQVFSRSGLDVLLQFDIGNLLQSSGSITFSIKFHDGTSKGSIVYVQGTSYPNPGQGVNISGDRSGKVNVTLKNVQKIDAGTYLISATGVPSRCIILYILGVPTIPTVTVNNNPEVGESAILTCSSTSTTTPSNHSLSLAYNWYVDNPADYSYSTNRKTLTVPDVTRNDASKRFTCSAKEDVKDGFTSNNSSSYSLNVLYGPDSLDFTPSNKSYEKVENTILSPVRCNASCNPPCSFKWNMADTMAAISENAVLDLGRLTSSQAGTYRCTATREDGSSRTKDLTVNIIYGPTNIYFKPAQASYRHDENFNLPPITCSSKCWDCQYSWKGPNMSNSRGPILDLDNLQRSMAGNYSCTATNIKSSPQKQISKELTIEVRYGPDSVSITPENETYMVDEGSTLNNIKCSADCFPSCKYEWTKENQTGIVSDTENLPLGEIPKSYAGKYTCTARNGDIQTRVSQKHVIINVRYGPYNSSTIISPSKKGYIQNKDTLLPNITCSAVCNPNCMYTWTKQKEEKISTVSTSGVLSLGILGPDQAATYTCTAKNPGKSESPTTRRQVTVKVRYGPEAVDISEHSPYNVTEGETVPNITCSADCFPGCTYNWRNLTDTTSKIISTSNVLSLKTVNRYMAGHYKCTSSNEATKYTKSSEKTLSVVVKYAPDVKTSLSSTNFTEGVDDLTLFCNGSGVPASFSYIGLTQKWNDIIIPNSNTALSGTKQYSSILFSPLRFQDTGTYTCALNNGIRNMQGILNQFGSRQIIVEVRPKILTGELRFTGATNGQAHIQVAVYSFPQLETLNITRYDGKVVVTDTKYNLTKHDNVVRTTFYGVSVSLNGTIIDMTIQNLEEYDFGNYTLMLTNRLGTSSKKLFLVAQSKPSAPKLFEYVSGHSVPTFMWQKNFNGGLNQSFVIQTSPDGAQMWTHHTNIHENDQRFKINSTFYMANITGLQPGFYNVRIFANNSEGDSDAVDLGYTFEIPKNEVDQNPLPVGAVIGGSASALIVIGIVIVILIVLKRRTGNKDGGKTRLDARKNQSDDTDDEDEVNTVNPMYVSADDVQQTDNTYAQPVKKKKKIAETKDVYAMVDKKAKKGKKDTDIYENAEPPDENSLKYKERKGNAYEENPYENPATATTKKPKKIVNKDGLIYADLAFNDQPKGQKKLVIHGLDSMTEYVEVDFSKKAEPLPDSDDEDSRKTT